MQKHFPHDGSSEQWEYVFIKYDMWFIVCCTCLRFLPIFLYWTKKWTDTNNTKKCCTHLQVAESLPDKQYPEGQRLHSNVLIGLSSAKQQDPFRDIHTFYSWAVLERNSGCKQTIGVLCFILMLPLCYLILFTSLHLSDRYSITQVKTFLNIGEGVSFATTLLGDTTSCTLLL